MVSPYGGHYRNAGTQSMKFVSFVDSQMGIRLT